MNKDPRFNSLACSLGQKHINYKELLERIVNGQEYTKKELEEAVGAACNWQLCSVGTLCELIPRRPSFILRNDLMEETLRQEPNLPLVQTPGGILASGSMSPKDERLKDLGFKFMYAMKKLRNEPTSAKAEEALRIHLQVEARAAEILNDTVTNEQWAEYLNKHSQ